jgi:TolA-binding protein
MRKRYGPLLAAMLLAFSGLPAPCQQADAPKPATGAAASADAKAVLLKGVDLFGQEKYQESLDLFGKVLSDPRAKAERPEAAYWSVLAYLAIGDQATAAAAIDAFVAAYPTSPRLPDLLYQRGRILYTKGDYEEALKVFAAFSEAAPNSDLFPSALYWSGECLYALGRLEEAERAFAAVVQKYPQSVKVEAATYRQSLIGLEYRQRELLKLLTWSHEESLKSVEDFRRREKAYEASISLYQKQISDTKRGAAGAASDQDRTAADLRASIADLSTTLATRESELASAKSEITRLRTALDAASYAAAQAGTASATPAPAPAQPLDEDDKAQALAYKSRALDLLAFYLDKIAKEGAK